MKKTKIFHAIAILFCLFFLGSCRSTKDIITDESTASLKHETNYFRELYEKQLQYESLVAKLQLEMKLSNGNNFSAKGQLKLKKDSCLQISIQPLLGIEVFRVELGLDSIKIVDRLNKRYISESYDELRGNTNIDFNFYNLQALFTNQLFLPGKKDISKKDFTSFNWAREDNFYTLKTIDATELSYIFVGDADEKIRSTSISADNSPYSLCWDYTNFRPLDKHLFPMSIKATLTTNQATAEITFNYSKLEKDSNPEIKFPIPSNYKRISIADLYKGQIKNEE